MRLVSYRRADGSESVGILRDDLNGPYDLIRALEIYAVASNLCVPIVSDMMDLLDAGLIDVELLRGVEAFVECHNLLEDLSDADDFTLLAPIGHPGAVYALGRNYPAHARASGAEVPTEPIVFGKAVTSIVGPEDDVVYKDGLTRVDPEAELAVIIGRLGSEIPENDAMSHVAGYTALNDVTARDLQMTLQEQKHPWFVAKGMDTFCPIGPCITLPDEIGEPIELDVKLYVNGELRQNDNTRSMTFDVPFMISWISRYFTLYPGDIIATGTPEGIAPVLPGDVMEVHVEKIGVLRNRVVGERRQASYDVMLNSIQHPF